MGRFTIQLLTAVPMTASGIIGAALLDAFGEVTPWDVESIDPDEADQRFGGIGGLDGAEADPHPRVISVRQRRDYRVPSVSALLRVADAARRNLVPADEEAGEVESVGEAVLEIGRAHV